jgi:hypothetical protein
MKEWKKDIPVGWKYRMSYDLRGDGSAIFTGPNGERVRVRPSFTLGWNSKSEPFGAAALRRLFEMYPQLKRKEA